MSITYMQSCSPNIHNMHTYFLEDATLPEKTHEKYEAIVDMKNATKSERQRRM